jgi:hypothetical protein
MRLRHHAVRSGAAAALVAAALAPAAAEAAGPKVDLLVAFRDGSAVQKSVKASKASVKVGGRRCAVPAATALATLIHSRIGPLKLKDFGSCSRRPVDAGGLYVAAIKGDKARGVSGWVYKAGQKVGTAGAGDPTGSFGRGRLKKGTRVTWFYCRMNPKTNSCQRTLVAKPEALGGGMLRVTVRAYDDRGKSRAAAGASVHAGDTTATTDSAGIATFSAPAGATGVYAQKPGAVRSFEEAVVVR